MGSLEKCGRTLFEIVSSIDDFGTIKNAITLVARLLQFPCLKWLSCVVRTYLYDAFDCMLLSCHLRDFRLNPHSRVAWMSSNFLLETGTISEV